MKQSKHLFLIRVIVVALLYCIGNRLAEFDFLMDYRVFAALLLLYSLLAIVGSKASEKISAVIRIATDALFITLCGIETCFYAYWMHKSPGEAGWGCWAIMMYSPMLILFIVWLAKDVKQLIKAEGDTKRC